MAAATAAENEESDRPNNGDRLLYRSGWSWCTAAAATAAENEVSDRPNNGDRMQYRWGGGGS